MVDLAEALRVEKDTRLRERFLAVELVYDDLPFIEAAKMKNFGELP
jgi:hypothetical protein